MKQRHNLSVSLIVSIAVGCGASDNSGMPGAAGAAEGAGKAAGGNYGASGASGSSGLANQTGGSTAQTAGLGGDSGGAGVTSGGSAGASGGSAGASGGSAGASGGVVGGQAGSNSAGSGGTGIVPAFDRAAVTTVMRRVADYEITRFGSDNNNDWVRAVFHTGMLATYRALGDAKYHDYTGHWAQVNKWQIHSASSGPRFADNQACVQSYAELYSQAPSADNAVMLSAAQSTFDSMVRAPKAGRVEWWWCDALYMAPAAMARVAQATGKPQYVTLMNDMFWDTKAFLYDPAQSLFWRDGSYVKTNKYWSRGNGWVVGGLARVLEALPENDSRRVDYETLLKQMSAKLRVIQQSDGFWRSSLTQPSAFPMPESSGTAFFCFAMAWGINHGVLDRATYLPVVTRAWAALSTAVNAQGRLGWVQAVGQEPGPSTADATNDYATGALLLAGEQLLKL